MEIGFSGCKLEILNLFYVILLISYNICLMGIHITRDSYLHEPCLSLLPILNY